MKIKEAIDLFQFYQKSTDEKRTLQSYVSLLGRFGAQYGERSLRSIGSEDVFLFFRRHHGRPRKINPQAAIRPAEGLL
jgi:hypothetical protein